MEQRVGIMHFVAVMFLASISIASIILGIKWNINDLTALERYQIEGEVPLLFYPFGRTEEELENHFLLKDSTLIGSGFLMLAFSLIVLFVCMKENREQKNYIKGRCNVQ